MHTNQHAEQIKQADEQSRELEKLHEDLKRKRASDLQYDRERRADRFDVEARAATREVDDPDRRGTLFDTRHPVDMDAAAAPAVRLDEDLDQWDTSDIMRDAGEIAADPKGLDVAPDLGIEFDGGDW